MQQAHRKASRLFVALTGCFIAAFAGAAERQLQIAPTIPAVAGEKRVALIIGNSAYKSSPLRNPVNDARAISKALADTGFKVTLIEDATQSTMRSAIRTFGNDIQNGTVGLFYYAGHGMQVKGKNFLIPVNADIEHEDEVEDQALDANLVLAKMDSAKNSLNLLILDACRNNPFQRSFRSTGQGLAQMEAPSGTLIAFATAPGSVAADGEGRNGVYTKHLLENIMRPGLPIEQLFKEVRIGVGKDTRDRQIPWESSSLRGNFYFVPGNASLAAEDQKRQIEKAVTERLTLERAEQQRNVEETIRQLLAKQRAELEEEMRKRGEKVSAVVPAPTQVASMAPQVTLPALKDPLYPKMGDRWQYTYVDAMTKRTRDLSFEVVGATRDGILESGGPAGTPVAQRAHAAGATLIYGEYWELSPFLLAFAVLKPGESLGEIPFSNYRGCNPPASCSFRGRVERSETIRTRAGTFDAIKIVVDLNARGLPGSNAITNPSWRELTFWYSEQVKRVVKSVMRSRSGPGADADYDIELVSYKLN